MALAKPARTKEQKKAGISLGEAIKINRGQSSSSGGGAPSSTTEVGGIGGTGNGGSGDVAALNALREANIAAGKSAYAGNAKDLSTFTQSITQSKATPTVSLSTENARNANKSVVQQLNEFLGNPQEQLVKAQQLRDELQAQLAREQTKATEVKPGVSATPPAATATTQYITPDNNIDLEAVSAQVQKDINADAVRANEQIAKLMERSDDFMADNLSTIGSLFNLRRQQQEEINSRQLSIMKTQGIRSGMARYSPQLNQSFLSEEESNGIMRLTELDINEQALIQQAQEANYNRNYDLLTKSLEQAQQIRSEKRNLVSDLSALATANQTRRQTEIKNLRDNEIEQFDFAVKKASTYASALAETFDELTDPEDKELAIAQLAEELDIDETILIGEVEKAMRALRLSELGVIKEEQTVASGNEIEIDGKLYRRTANGGYEQVISTGDTAITGPQVGEISGLPAYDTRSANPGAKRSDRNNNPGNIKISNYTKSFAGVVGVESNPAEDGGNFIIFESPEAGLAAMGRLLLEGNSYQGVTAAKAIKKYNGGGLYSASDVGLDPDKDFQSQIQDPAKLRAVTLAMAKAEGWSGAQTSAVRTLVESGALEVKDLSKDQLRELADSGYTPPVNTEEAENANRTLENVEKDLADLNRLATETNIKNSSGKVQGVALRPGTKEGKEAFLAQMSYIINNLTFEKLNDLKAGGATFGALSDGERRAIGNATGRIANLANFDGEELVGFKGGEEELRLAIEEIRKNLEKSRERLAKEAGIELSLNTIGSDDLAEIDSILGTSGTTSSTINPASWY